MNDFFLIKWWKSSSVNKAIIIAFSGMFLFCCCSTAFVMLGAFVDNDKTAFESNTAKTEKGLEDEDNEASTTSQDEKKDCITDPTGEVICPAATQPKQPTQVKPTPTLSKQAFEVVCFGGKVEDAPKYTPDSGTKEPHAAVAFYIRPGSNYASQSGIVFPDDYEAIEIVACLRRIGERLQISCDYQASTGERFKREYYHATHEMSVFEAHTGALLGKQIVETKSNWKCSTFQKVLSTDDIKSYASPSFSKLETLLQPYINP